MKLTKRYHLQGEIWLMNHAGRWLLPVPKVSFVAKAGGDICLVGAYNPE
jgi:hypothetical protein